MARSRVGRGFKICWIAYGGEAITHQIRRVYLVLLAICANRIRGRSLPIFVSDTGNFFPLSFVQPWSVNYGTVEKRRFADRNFIIEPVFSRTLEPVIPRLLEPVA